MQNRECKIEKLLTIAMPEYTIPIPRVRQLDHLIEQAPVHQELSRLFLHFTSAINRLYRVHRNVNLLINKVMIPRLQPSCIVHLLKYRCHFLKQLWTLVANDERQSVESTECLHNQPAQINVHGLLTGCRVVADHVEILHNQEVILAVNMRYEAGRDLGEWILGILLDRLELDKLLDDAVVKVDFVPEELR